MEGIGGSRCRRYLDWLAVTGFVLELWDAACGGTAGYSDSGINGSGMIPRLGFAEERACRIPDRLP